MTDPVLLSLSIMALRDALIFAVQKPEFADAAAIDPEKSAAWNGFLAGMAQREAAIFQEINARGEAQKRAIVQQFGRPT